MISPSLSRISIPPSLGFVVYLVGVSGDPATKQQPVLLLSFSSRPNCSVYVVFNLILLLPFFPYFTADRRRTGLSIPPPFRPFVSYFCLLSPLFFHSPILFILAFLYSSVPYFLPSFSNFSFSSSLPLPNQNFPPFVIIILSALDWFISPSYLSCILPFSPSVSVLNLFVSSVFLSCGSPHPSSHYFIPCVLSCFPSFHYHD